MTKKEMFRKAIAEAAGKEAPVKATARNPDVLIKRECIHKECAGLSKCKKAQTCGGVEV